MNVKTVIGEGLRVLLCPGNKGYLLELNHSTHGREEPGRDLLSPSSHPPPDQGFVLAERNQDPKWRPHDLQAEWERGTDRHECICSAIRVLLRQRSRLREIKVTQPIRDGLEILA